MAVSSLYHFTLASHRHYQALSPIRLLLPNELHVLRNDHTKRRSRARRLVASSTHSNARILMPNRKYRCGQLQSSYDDDDEEEEDDDEGDDSEDDDWLSDEDDEFAEPVEFQVRGGRFKHEKKIPSKQISQRHLNARGDKRTRTKNFVQSTNHSRMRTREADEVVGKEKLMSGERSKNTYEKLSEEIDLDKKWIPLLDYLSTFGLKESHFIKIYERHMPSLQMNVCSAQERLEYLLSIGVKHRDIKRILLRQPQILEYTIESNLKSHVSFLRGLGIPNSRLGQIIAAAPSLFSYSVENSLKPTIRYLVEEVGINEKKICKVVQLSPQILVQRIDISWNTRYMFLSKELGASRESVVKMVTKHPQLLHYSIDDGFLPRINFLRSIGMRNSDILKVLTSLTQVLSLSLEDNLKPKYLYLINELRNEVQSLTKYPTYLSLSLDQRIRPRHRFLVSLKKAPKGPFPLGSFVPTDECFCENWAGTSLDKYLEFRQQLQLKKFAKRYGR